MMATAVTKVYIAARSYVHALQWADAHDIHPLNFSFIHNLEALRGLRGVTIYYLGSRFTNFTPEELILTGKIGEHKLIPGYVALEPKPKSRRGFASTSPAKVRAIASLGGSAVPAAKRSFSVNRKLAAEAGRKGGLSRAKRFAEETAKLNKEAGL